jgi:hypothetical protein
MKGDRVSSLLIHMSWVNYHFISAVSTRKENDVSVVDSEDHVVSCPSCHYPETKSYVTTTQQSISQQGLGWVCLSLSLLKTER